MKKTISLLASLMLAGFLSLFAAAPAQAYSAPNADIQKILDDTNAARAANGLSALTLNQQMTAVAQNWSQAQSNAGSMSHNPNYSGEIPGGWSKAAENVAYGYAVNAVVNGWMNSPGHRANILGDYNSIGIGYANGYYTQVFAKYNNVAPVQPPVTPPAPEPVPEPEPEPEPAPAPEPEAAPAPAPVAEAPAEEQAPAEVTATEAEVTPTPTPSETLEPESDEVESTAVDIASDAPADALVGPEAPAKEMNPWLLGIVIAAGVGIIVASYFLYRVLRKPKKA